MADARDLDGLPRPATPPDDAATLVAWTASTGDSTKSHVVHVDPTGLAWALGLKQPEAFGQLVGAATMRPAELIEAHPGAASACPASGWPASPMHSNSIS